MTHYFFRLPRAGERPRWLLVRKAHWDRHKKPEDVWLTRQRDLFGDLLLAAPPGFAEVEPGVVEFAGPAAGSAVRAGEAILKGAGFVYKGGLT